MDESQGGNLYERKQGDELEDGLRRALARRDAPAGFADRMMARIAAETSAHRAPWWRQASVGYRALAAGVVLAAAIGGGFLQRQHELHQREQAEGEHARQQVMLALRITAITLDSVDSKINDDRKTDGKTPNDGTTKEEQP